MSDSLTIRSYRHEYKVYFIDEYLPALIQHIRDRDVVFIDKNIFNLYPDIAEILEKRWYRIIEPNEEAKSFHQLEAIIDDLSVGGMNKTNRIIAIGGGIVQDVTAFTASIFFRGIDWIFFPTNLLSQADSCIGSKTSINFKTYKNQLGSFYPPNKIFIASSFLETLTEREILSGLGEIMHYFCVSEDDDFPWAREKIVSALKDKTGFDRLVRRSLQIKKSMIEIDEFDTGPRNVFNYGHSFGHALESVTNYTIPHGIAVCFGMDLANCISVKLGLISMGFRNEIRQALIPIWENFDLDLSNCKLLFVALTHDKKNEGPEIKVILTRGLGKMFKTTLRLNRDMKRFISDYFVGKKWERDL